MDVIPERQRTSVKGVRAEHHHKKGKQSIQNFINCYHIFIFTGLLVEFVKHNQTQVCTMSSQDDFIHVASASSSSRSNTVTSAFYDNFAGKFTFTEGVIARRIREQYPHHHLSIVYSGSCDLLSYADAHDDTTRTPHGDSKDALIERGFLPPAKKDGKECNGAWVEYVTYACYEYVFRSKKFLVYVIEGGEGQYRDPKSYILVPPPDSDAVTPSIEWLSVAQKRADELIAEVSAWGLETHNEILIFDGYWKKDNELWQNVQNSEWKDVILEEEKKKAIIDDVIGFFDNEDRYKDLGVPWKVSLPRACERMTLTRS